jgi:hypothetical protein
VGEADRERFRAEALSLAEKLVGDQAEKGVWEVYARTEKMIAILKFRLDYETPGVFAKLPDAGDPAELLKEAHELLSKASEEIAQSRFVESIATLREARNDLRSYLTEARRSATRAERKPRGSSRKP